MQCSQVLLHTTSDPTNNTLRRCLYLRCARDTLGPSWCASSVKGERATQKPCFRCGVAKAEDAFGVAAWKARHADRRVCKACAVIKVQGTWRCARSGRRALHGLQRVVKAARRTPALQLVCPARGRARRGAARKQETCPAQTAACSGAADGPGGGRPRTARPPP